MDQHFVQWAASEKSKDKHEQHCTMCNLHM
jgi:hypothetical protein